MFESKPLRVSQSARAAVLRRCGGACEACGLEWPWLLHLFLVDGSGRPAAANLVALCGPCSYGRPGAFAPLMTAPSLRARLLAASNARTGARKLTAAGRLRLIAERGGRCEACGISGDRRRLEVHHRLAVLRGGDDSPANLMVLCFACHHHVRPCQAGCGRWAKKPETLCPRCRLHRLIRERRPTSD